MRDGKPERGGVKSKYMVPKRIPEGEKNAIK